MPANPPPPKFHSTGSMKIKVMKLFNKGLQLIQIESMSSRISLKKTKYPKGYHSLPFLSRC